MAVVETGPGRRELRKEPCGGYRSREITAPDALPTEAGGCDADPILSLRGMGKDIWAREEADAYVARLREGWR